ncbi:ABC transporter ATP-binding protein [Sporosarcina pasteurii]|uniref:Uncharacterized ABC transporter ATP-binding protein YbhF n=1 Tax=Sporosarcina pasteurii TaxID=1474 RepID=A0A380BB99_SPOPA|nr:ABC transporter ATP-binding protein [Sporosarcina pasteurii]MDS9472888.1 ABC transporter ATP-binding protein [Sporosarcina pasteurii]QBQ06436.1 ABC transporter ATP-binding protein [Sporosarcina pasteurii]SUI98485.1 Uncharacterized ABC transporter ATP-binding protein YbhF [Sporosarcina pasteurii]
MLLHVEQLTKAFGDEKAANQLSFELTKHTSTALIGPNGAGKTTTLSMLAGLVTPTGGKITFQEEKRQDNRELIGFLPQYPKFFPWMTALEFTEMAARLSGIPARKSKVEAQKTLEFVGLGNALSKKTMTFSGGMKQRLGLAQAIVHKPKLLLLDEPVSALDPVGRREIMNLLKELQQEVTILYSTHILNDAEEMTDKLLFLREGELVEQGTLEDVRNRHANPRIVIEFINDSELQRFVNQTLWYTTIKGPKLSIDIEKESINMSGVLSALYGGDFQIRKVEQQTASLEEIFMKVAVM